MVVRPEARPSTAVMGAVVPLSLRRAAGGRTPLVDGGVSDENRETPQAFCWTRFGTEAGEPIERILARKEAERQTNHGEFLWGIGNSVAPALCELLRRNVVPEVLFSPIKSRPRNGDVAPPRVVSWRAAETIAGDLVELSPSVQVLSRAPVDGDPAPHYALVCLSLEPLVPYDYGRLEFGALRNFLSGSPLGASQVTAVVAHDANQHGGGTYPVVLRATLVAPYFLRLRAPQPGAPMADEP